MAKAHPPSADESPKDADSPASHADSSASDADSPSSDKDRFLAALEAKKGKSGYGSESHLTGGSTAHGKSAKAGGKREFRRKSG